MSKLTTFVNNWKNLRSVANGSTDEDIAATPATKLMWSYIESNIGTEWVTFADEDSTGNESAVNALKVRFRFSSGDGTTATYHIFTSSAEDDDWEYICTGTATAGAMGAGFGGVSNDTYADTITITNYGGPRWFASNGQGNNYMATIQGDLEGGRHVLITLSSVSAGTCYIDIKGY